MQIRTHFHHVNTSNEFDGRLQDWLAEKLSKWANVENLVLEAYILTIAPRRETHGATYECHMTATAPWLSKKIVVKETHTDFWTMLYNCVHKTRRQIQKLTASNRTRRRRGKHDTVVAV